MRMSVVLMLITPAPGIDILVVVMMATGRG
jgi:hypothetical protein